MEDCAHRAAQCCNALYRLHRANFIIDSHHRDERHAVIKDRLDRAANTAALLYTRIPRLNWVGFYFLQGETLVLSPFQGLPACTRIPLGRGVCGTAAERRETLLVSDAHAFVGHITCDSASASEIVVPLCDAGQLIGVLDVDSPEPNRFGPGGEIPVRSRRHYPRG